MTRLKRQASQELLPTRAPKLIRGKDPSVFSRVTKFLYSNYTAFCEAATEDVIPKPSHRPNQSHPPSRSPRKPARSAIPKEFRTESQPSVGPSPPSSSTPSPTRRPETTRSSLPVFPPPPQPRAPTAFPSTISQQGSQESVTSVETLLASAQRRRRNGIKNHRTSGLPAYYQSRDHIYAKRHKAEIQKSRKLEREEMLKALYEERRSKGYKSNYDDFKSLLEFTKRLEQEKIIRGSLSPSASMSDLRSKPSSTPKEQRRRSATEFHRETELDDDFLKRLIQKAKKSLDGPPPKRPFVPSLEQLRLSRKAEGDAIEQILRPKKAPLPPHLPPEDEAYVDAILTKRGAISKSGREQVADKDIARLRPHQWLNDEIINFYGQLIVSRSEGQKENSASTSATNRINGLVNGIKGKGKAEVSDKKPLNVHYFSTFFWPKLTGDGYDKGRLAKWTKKFDLFSKDVVLIPVNHSNSHWTAAAINFRKKRIQSYDSMGTARSEVHKALRKYLDDEHQNKKKKPFDFTGWVDWVDENTPQQENGYDCGVFTCQFLQALSRGEEDDFGFTQVDMPYLRRRMIWEIANAKLHDDP